MAKREWEAQGAAAAIHRVWERELGLCDGCHLRKGTAQIRNVEFRVSQEAVMLRKASWASETR